MTKKQMGLIFTLMALLVCVAVLSLKLNESGLKDPSDLAATITNNDNENKSDDNKNNEDKNDSNDKNKNEQETSAQQSSIIALRSDSEKIDATAIQNLQSIINNSNSSQEQIDRATQELSLRNKVVDQQKRIETNIKLLGYSDVLCLIDSGKAKVYIKSSEQLDDAKVAAINEAVETVASDVTSTLIKTEK